MPELKLGRLPRAYDPRVPKLADLLRDRDLPPPPPTANWVRTLPLALGMMLNDTYGDCAEAAWGHAVQVWSENAAGKIWTIADANIERLYEQATGFNPNDPDTDQGTILQSLLAYLVKTGGPIGADGSGRHKLKAFVEVDVTDLDSIKRTIVDCGVCYIGFNVPAYLMTSGPPEIWDLNPNANNTIVGGHCVALAGYRPQGLYLISWGQVYRMTWGFFQKFCDEAYGLADGDWIAKRGTTPGGLSLEELEAAMAAIKGGG